MRVFLEKGLQLIFDAHLSLISLSVVMSGKKNLDKTNLFDNSEATDFEIEVSNLELSNVSTQNFPEYVLGKIERERRKSEGTLSVTKPPYEKKFVSSPNIEVLDGSGQKVDEENLVKFLSRTNTPSVKEDRKTADDTDEPVHYVRGRRRSSIAKYVWILAMNLYP